MLIVERMPGDADELRRRAATERDARRRDRWRAVLMAVEGREAAVIAAALGRSRRSVQDWAYAYRDGGIDAVQPKPRTGRVAKLSPQQEAALRARLDAGPTADDGVCTLRGRDVVRILKAEFGVVHTLGSIYGVLRRVGYSSLSPRPRHRKNDKAAMEKFAREDAPLLPGR